MGHGIGHVVKFLGRLFAHAHVNIIVDVEPVSGMILRKIAGLAAIVIAPRMHCEHRALVDRTVHASQKKLHRTGAHRPVMGHMSGQARCADFATHSKVGDIVIGAWCFDHV